jgi:AP-1-like factor
VHDLEGRVAELEAAQRAKDVENENLRDLLARLQDENRVLKDAAFTFSMPPPPPPPPLHHHASSSSSSSASMYSAGPSATPQLVQNSPPPAQADIDWASLTTFDPAALNMLDADINMMDFSAPEPTDVGSPYRTIASNPMFMSFADFSPPTRQNSGSSAAPAQWDMSFSSLGAWPGAPPSRQPSDLEQLLGLPAPPMDLVASPQSLSPVIHGARPAPAPVQSPVRTALPDLAGVAHPFQFAPGAHASPPAPENGENPTQCPRTRADFAARIARELSSPFAAGGAPAVPPSNGMGCEGAGFPKTERSEANIEVLAAWRRITSDPQFQHVDINELCAEFTNKAKCDGTRVVLDPAGVSQIISKFAAAR